MRKTLISIVMPVYNVENYIRNCMSSVINQNFTDYEIIWIDDGSTDNSGSICDEYTARYDHIRGVHKNNEGLYQARLDGARMAVGEYLWFVDSDDEIMDGSLEVLSRAIAQNDRPDVLIFDYQRSSGAVAGAHRILPPGLYAGGEMGKIAEELCRPDAVAVPAVWRKCFKRELIINNENLTDKIHFCFGEDLVISASALDKADKCFVMSEILYLYRYNAESITHKYNYKKLEDQKVVFEQLNLLADGWEKKYGLNMTDYIRHRTAKMCVGEFKLLLESDLNWNDKQLEIKKLVSDDFFQASVQDPGFVSAGWWRKYLQKGLTKSKDIYKFSKKYTKLCAIKNAVKRVCERK